MSKSSLRQQQLQLQQQQQQQQQMMADNDAAALAAELFDVLCAATTMRQILGLYRNMCDTIGLRPGPINEFYPKLKLKIRSWKAQALWKKFDTRASHRVYNKGNACNGSRVLVIGAGPCGLRAAIEAQLLGAKVCVVEKRDRISRNNVVHLWPFVITDLRNLGAKKFYGKFCAGSIDHISIRQLQCILLKVALLLGVEIHEGVSFINTIEPSDGCGWRAEVTPTDHAVSHYEFDVLFGADGKRNTLEGFKRKEFRGKLAIAITANFINKKTEAEARAEEISGVAFIFNQSFFKELYQTTGIDLENIVYYKDETHYFVMTAKKHSLIDKNVIIQDFADPAELLSSQNVNTDKLLDYAREAAEFSTKYQMPNLEFAVNHYGKPDVAMFDFTSMFAAEASSRVIVRKNYRLLQCLVGDSLLEPFWPTGSGCARGFLSSMDAAYMIKLYANQRNSILGTLAQRESIYRLLAQTTPENLQRDIGAYTVDPATRYPNLNKSIVNVWQVKHLIDTDDPNLLEQVHMDTNALQQANVETPIRRKRRTGDLIPLNTVLLRWIKCQLHANEFAQNLTESSECFTHGNILCALINRYRPDLIDLNTIKDLQPIEYNELAFKILETELNIPRCISAKQSMTLENVDSKIWLNYLEQICEGFRGEIPHVKHPKLDYLELKEKSSRDKKPDFSHLLNRTTKSKAKSPMQDIDLTANVHRRSILDEEKARRLQRKNTGNGNEPVVLASGYGGDTSRRAKKRRSQEKTSNIEERQQRLKEIEANRLERQSKRKQQRYQQTQNFYKSLQMLQAQNYLCDDGNNDQPFEDYSIYMYRQNAPEFNDRVKMLEKKLLHPDRERGIQSAFPRSNDEQFSNRIKSMEQQITSRTTSGTDKKPKDLLRAIGKIDSNDWNIREIEKKIEQSKKTEIPGKSKEKVPKWSKEQFLARQNKMSKPPLEREESTEEKFKEIDQTLKNLDKQLKEGSIREIGERGKNKVASIAGQFGKKDDTSDEKPVPQTTKSNSKVPSVFKKQSASEKCHFCKQTVYLMEKIATENLILHRSCLKCYHCHTNLRLGACVFDRDDPVGRFYCTQHFKLPAKEIRPMAKKSIKQQKKTPTAVALQSTEDGDREISDQLPRGRPETIAQLDLLDRGETPERIEFENADAMSDGEPSLENIIDENEWTDRNFVTDSEDSESDLSSSDESDDESESFEDADDGSPIAQTLQLATDWIGKQRYSNGGGIDDSDNDFYDSSDGMLDENDADSQTEGEEFKKAREMRRQEVKLLPIPTNLPTDTETEVISKDDAQSNNNNNENNNSIDNNKNSNENLINNTISISSSDNNNNINNIPLIPSKTEIKIMERDLGRPISTAIDSLNENLFNLNNFIKLNKEVDNIRKENVVKIDIMKKLALKEKWLNETTNTGASNLSLDKIKEPSETRDIIYDDDGDSKKTKTDDKQEIEKNNIIADIVENLETNKMNDDKIEIKSELEDSPNDKMIITENIEIEDDEKNNDNIIVCAKEIKNEIIPNEVDNKINEIVESIKSVSIEKTLTDIESENKKDLMKSIENLNCEILETKQKSDDANIGQLLYDVENKCSPKVRRRKTSSALKKIEARSFADTKGVIESQITGPKMSKQSSLDLSRYFPNQKQEKTSTVAANKNQKTLKDVDLNQYFAQSPVAQRKTSITTKSPGPLRKSSTEKTIPALYKPTIKEKIALEGTQNDITNPSEKVPASSTSGPGYSKPSPKINQLHYKPTMKEILSSGPSKTEVKSIESSSTIETKPKPNILHYKPTMKEILAAHVDGPKLDASNRPIPPKRQKAKESGGGSTESLNKRKTRDSDFDIYDQQVDGSVDLKKKIDNYTKSDDKNLNTTKNKIIKKVPKKSAIDSPNPIKKKLENGSPKSKKKLLNDEDDILNEILNADDDEIRSPSIEYQKLFQEEKSPSEDISDRIEKILIETGIDLGLPRRNSNRKKLLKAKSLGEDEFISNKNQLSVFDGDTKEEGDEPQEGFHNILKRFESLSSIKNSNDKTRESKFKDNNDKNSNIYERRYSRESIKSKKSSTDEFSDLERTLEYLKSEWKTEASNFLQKKRTSFFSNPKSVDELREQVEEDKDELKRNTEQYFEEKKNESQIKDEKIKISKEKSPKRKISDNGNIKVKEMKIQQVKQEKEPIKRKKNDEKKIESKTKEVIKKKNNNNTTIDFFKPIGRRKPYEQFDSEIEDMDVDDIFNEIVNELHITDDKLGTPDIQEILEPSQKICVVNKEKNDITKSGNVKQNSTQQMCNEIKQLDSAANTDFIKSNKEIDELNIPKADHKINIYNKKLDGSQIILENQLDNCLPSKSIIPKIESSQNNNIESIKEANNSQKSHIINESNKKDISPKKLEIVKNSLAKSLPEEIKIQSPSDNTATWKDTNEKNSLQHDPKINDSNKEILESYIKEMPKEKESSRKSSLTKFNNLESQGDSKKSALNNEVNKSNMEVDEINQNSLHKNKSNSPNGGIQSENKSNLPKQNSAKSGIQIEDKSNSPKLNSPKNGMQSSENKSSVTSKSPINVHELSIVNRSKSSTDEDSIEQLFSQFTDDMLVDVEFDSNEELISITPRAIIKKRGDDESDKNAEFVASITNNSTSLKSLEKQHSDIDFISRKSMEKLQSDKDSASRKSLENLQSDRDSTTRKSLEKQQIDRYSTSRKSFEKQQSNRDFTSRKSFEKQQSDRDSTSRKSLEKLQNDKDSTSGKSFEKQQSGRDSTSHKSVEKQLSNRDSISRKSFEKQQSDRDSTSRKSFEKQKSDRDSSSRKSLEKVQSDRDSTSRKSFEAQQSGRDSTSRKSFVKQQSDRDSTSRKSFEAQQSGRDSTCRKSIDKQQNDRDSTCRKSLEKLQSDRDSTPRKSFESQQSGKDSISRKSFEKQQSDRDSTSRKSFEAQQSGRDSTCRKSFEKQQNDRDSTCRKSLEKLQSDRNSTPRKSFEKQQSDEDSTSRKSVDILQNDSDSTSHKSLEKQQDDIQFPMKPPRKQKTGSSSTSPDIPSIPNRAKNIAKHANEIPPSVQDIIIKSLEIINDDSLYIIPISNAKPVRFPSRYEEEEDITMANSSPTESQLSDNISKVNDIDVPQLDPIIGKVDLTLSLNPVYPGNDLNSTDEIANELALTQKSNEFVPDVNISILNETNLTSDNVILDNNTVPDDSVHDVINVTPQSTNACLENKKLLFEKESIETHLPVKKNKQLKNVDTYSATDDSSSISRNELYNSETNSFHLSGNDKNVIKNSDPIEDTSDKDWEIIDRFEKERNNDSKKSDEMYFEKSRPEEDWEIIERLEKERMTALRKRDQMYFKENNLSSLVDRPRVQSQISSSDSFESAISKSSIPELSVIPITSNPPPPIPPPRSPKPSSSSRIIHGDKIGQKSLPIEVIEHPLPASDRAYSPISTQSKNSSHSLSHSIESIPNRQQQRPKSNTSENNIPVDYGTRILLERSQMLRDRKKDFMEDKMVGNNPYMKKMITTERKNRIDSDNDDDIDSSLDSYRPSNLNSRNINYSRFPTTRAIQDRSHYNSAISSGIDRYGGTGTNTSSRYSSRLSPLNNSSYTSPMNRSHHLTDYFKRSPSTSKDHHYHHSRDQSKDSCVQSDSESSSADNDVNSATEISTDSEFDHDPIIRETPKIFIDDTHLRKPTKVQIKQVIIGNNGTNHPPKLHNVTNTKLTSNALQNALTHQKLEFKPLVQVDPSLLNSNRIMPLKNPRPGDYLLNKTASTEGIASKTSLELKKRYLLGSEQQCIIGGNKIMKSGSTSILDTKLKSFHSNISECQKKLNQGNNDINSIGMKTFLDCTTKKLISNDIIINNNSNDIEKKLLNDTEIKLKKDLEEKENVFVNSKNELNKGMEYSETINTALIEHITKNSKNIQPIIKIPSPIIESIDLITPENEITTTLNLKQIEFDNVIQINKNEKNNETDDSIEIIDLTYSPPIKMIEDKTNELIEISNISVNNKPSIPDIIKQTAEKNQIDLSEKKIIDDDMPKISTTTNIKTDELDNDCQDTCIQVPQIPWPNKKKLKNDVESDSLSSSSATSSLEDIPHYILDSTTSPDTHNCGAVNGAIVPRLEIHDSSGALMQIDSLMIIDGKYIGDPEDLPLMEIPEGMTTSTSTITDSTTVIDITETKDIFEPLCEKIIVAKELETVNNNSSQLPIVNSTKELKFDSKNENKIESLKNLPLIYDDKTNEDKKTKPQSLDLGNIVLQTSSIGTKLSPITPTPIGSVADNDKTPTANDNNHHTDSETEQTGQLLTETELSDWTADDAVSENFVDIEFVLNSNKGTIKRNKKGKKGKLNSKIGNISHTKNSLRQEKYSPAVETPRQGGGILENLAIGEIDFMDTGSEGSCAETYAATNNALIKNRGYIEFIENTAHNEYSPTTTTGNNFNIINLRQNPNKTTNYSVDSKSYKRSNSSKEILGIDYIEQGACILNSSINNSDIELKTPVNEISPPIFSIGNSVFTGTETITNQHSPKFQQNQLYSLTDSTNELDDDSLVMMTSQSATNTNTTTTEESDALTVVTSPLDSSSPRTQENVITTTISTSTTSSSIGDNNKIKDINKTLSSNSNKSNNKTTSPLTRAKFSNDEHNSSISRKRSSQEDLLSSTKRKDSDEISYEEYVRKLQQKITQISNAKDSIDVRKQKRKTSRGSESVVPTINELERKDHDQLETKDLSQINKSITSSDIKSLSIFESSQKPINNSVTNNFIKKENTNNQQVHKVPEIPTLSSKLEEITKERTKQKDLIHDLVMDKLQSKKQLNAEKRLIRNRNRNSFFSPRSDSIDNNNLMLSSTPKLVLSSPKNNYNLTKSASEQIQNFKENIPNKKKNSSPRENKDIVEMFNQANVIINRKQRPLSDNLDKVAINYNNFEQLQSSNAGQYETPIRSTTATRLNKNVDETSLAANTGKLKAEARARARLKTNQDLGLSPEEKLEILRKRYHLDLRDVTNGKNTSDELKARQRKMITSKSVNDISIVQHQQPPSPHLLISDENFNTTKSNSNIIDFTSDPNLSNSINCNNSKPVQLSRRHKDPERRKSLIQTFSNFFNKGKKVVNKDSSTMEFNELKQPVDSATGNVFSRFKISPKEKHKSKTEILDKDETQLFKQCNLTQDCLNNAFSSTPYLYNNNNNKNIDDTALGATASSEFKTVTSATIPGIFNNVDDDDDDEVPPPIPPLPVIYQKTDDGNYSSADIRDYQKKQRSIKASKQAELKRIRIAQEIEREQEEIEVQLKVYEKRGVVIEKALRGEGQNIENLETSSMGDSDEKLLKELLEIWRNITQLKKRDEELGIRQQELKLEHRHAQLKDELNIRLSCSKLDKSSADVAAEGAILNEMLEIVAKRAALRPNEQIAGTSKIKSTTNEHDQI